ncbi:MAG: FAD-dependent oxidoreductase, partial [Bacteroidota bacterium]|nr:FAD-dependent oxidoreductase [Bacteroidota bacterium]
MDFDFLVIGAGVVGLATAEYFSRNNLRILVIEKENKIGTGVSSR